MYHAANYVWLAMVRPVWYVPWDLPRHGAPQGSTRRVCVMGYAMGHAIVDGVLLIHSLHGDTMGSPTRSVGGVPRHVHTVVNRGALHVEFTHDGLPQINGLFHGMCLWVAMIYTNHNKKPELKSSEVKMWLPSRRDTLTRSH